MQFKVGEMEVKVGDKFRLTREGIKKYLKNNWRINDKLLFGAVVDELDDIKKVEDCFELVPEESEFKQGELIEVRDHEDGNWYRLPFIYKIPGKARNHYITVTALDVHAYNNNQEYSVEGWRYARKIKPQLTRKEIAERFGVSEDFTLVDDVNTDEIQSRR